jgi:hypothetical protein
MNTEILEMKINVLCYEHYMKFVDWLSNFTTYDLLNQLYIVEIETHVIKKMTLKKVYKYWVKNILNN